MTTQATEARRDVYIENDSGGFSVVPSSAVDRIIEDDRRSDRAIVTAHQALLLQLHGDDSFPARLVVGGPLSADEDVEWIARVTWRLDVPCGRLLLCGGFDPRAFAGWREDDENWLRTTHALAVPPGDYRVDVYTHRPTISGRFLEDAWPRPAAAWFRHEHSGRPWPAWLAEELESDPEPDAGHEEEWGDGRRPAWGVDESRRNVIGYLVHLRQWDGTAVPTPLPPDGWFEPETGARVPARCPLGLPSDAMPYEY
jgi:hypothetical protein